ncbi:MAG: DUF1080 domain-containing protein [Ruminococcaceae bacterium]|nr:DUF1080 domain-containing protein [Oscillospiraceae bacterium]
MLKKIVAAILLAAIMIPVLAGCKETEDPEVIGPVFNLTDEELEVFSNPITLDNVSAGGTGDPFIMRYDGVYYLYPSTSAREPYVRCWSSKDLVNWNYEGYVASHKLLDNAYAPEVTYFNGKFYMYSATPDGATHRCLVSTSPTGPFKFANDEGQGRKIDGHVFIDNDGKWYFYSASGDGIKVYPMQSPEWIGNDSIGDLAQITGAWTEGPMVVYHDGYYYLTATGNHLRNKSYRIVYGHSTTAPYVYNVPDDNIVLISTIGELVTTGHSSSVKAPDLDGYYITYHTFLASSGSIPSARYMNIDRIIFDGTSMSVLGPTAGNQVYSSMPDIYAYFDSSDELAIFEKVNGTVAKGKLTLNSGEKVISKEALSGSKYTIEVTTSGIDKNAKAGVIFGYSDEKNYGSAVFDTKNEKLIITFVVDGKKTTHEEKLVRSFDMPYDFSAVQAIQVEKSGNTFTFYVNDRELAKYESELSGMKVGLTAEAGKASFGFFGASDEVGGSSNCDFYKTVSSQSGTIPAHLCLEDDEIDKQKDKDDTTYVKASFNDSFNYRIYATEGGNHTFNIRYRAQAKATVEVYIDGNLSKTMTLEPSEKYTSVAVSGVMADEGKHVVTLYMKEGNAELKSFTMLKIADSGSMTLDFKSDSKTDRLHTDGKGWKVSGGKLVGNDLGKRVYGDIKWGDYTYEGEITFEGKTIGSGLLFRTTDAADSSLDLKGEPTTENTAKTGENWMQGYYLYFTAREIVLKKCNYNIKTLTTATYRITPDVTYKFKVVCDGANIKLYVNDELLIDYTDADPFLNGAVGMRVTSGTAKYDNIKVNLKQYE